MLQHNFSPANPGQSPPAVRKAREALAEYLNRNPLKPGERLPSERTLARETATSQAAMNRACNELIAEGKLRRSGRRLFLGQKSLDPGAQPRILLVTPFDTILVAARRAIKDFRANMDIICEEEPTRRNIRTMEILQEGAEGVLFWPMPPAGIVSQHLREQQVPAISMARTASEMDSVTIDNISVTREMCRHVAARGHRRILLILDSRGSEASEILRWFTASNYARWTGDPDDAILIIENTQPEEGRRRLAESLNRPDRPTALIAASALPLPVVYEEINKCRLRVPEDLSLASLSGEDFRALEKDLTRCEASDTILLRTAVTQLDYRIREKADVYAPTPPIRIQIVPEIHEGETVRDLQEDAEEEEDPVNTSQMRTVTQRWMYDPDSLGLKLVNAPVEERRVIVQRMNSAAYERVRAIKANALEPVDLEPHVTRGVRRPNQWLGSEPLRHFHAGRHLIHGIPFEVATRENDNCGALVLPPSETQTDEPQRAEILIGRKIRALYFLHGCGMSIYGSHFADYRLTWNDPEEPPHSVPLICAGYRLAPPKTAPNANIQDWWSPFPRIEGPHFRPCCITRDLDPCLYERYLYTLELVNPHPDRPVRTLVIERRPDTKPALGILGITLLLNE